MSSAFDGPVTRRRKNPRTRQFGTAGTAVFKRVRADRLRVTRHNLPLVVKFTALWITVAGATCWMFTALGRTGAAWFAAGAYTAGYAGMLAFFYSVLGLVNRRMGGTAERDTADRLLRIKGDDWYLFNHLLFPYGDGDVDVDHVFASHSRILAIETKWTAWPHKARDDGRLQGLSPSWLDAAKRSASLVSHLFHTAGCAASVTPVLVLWGPGIPRTKDGWFKVGRVVVWLGESPGGWMSVLEQITPRATVPPQARARLLTHAGHRSPCA